MNLSHNNSDCTGRWRYEVVGGALYWRCQGCRALAYHCDAVADAAILENSMGSVLRELTEAGRMILDNEAQR